MSKSLCVSLVIILLGVVLIFVESVPEVVGQGACPFQMEKIENGETVTGRISENTPSSQICFEGQAGDIVTIELSRTSGSLDAFLQLFDLDQEEILARNDDRSLSTTDAQIVFELPETSAYVINATRFDQEDGTTQGTFELTLSLSSDSVLDTDREVRADGCPVLYDTIQYGDTFEGTIDDDDLYYNFCFVGEEGDEVIINAVANDADLDTVLFLTDLRFEDTLAENDDLRLGSRDSRITYILPESGGYLITVSRYDFDEGTTEGDFTLSIELNDGTFSSEDFANDDFVPHPYECNRPLIKQLNATQWLEQNVGYNFRLNFGCEGLVAVSILGEMFTSSYEFVRGELQVTLDNQSYSVELQTDGTLKLTSGTNQEFVFSDVGDCSNQTVQELIEGVWFIDENTTLFRLDFMCNDVLILTLDGDSAAYGYELNPNTDTLSINFDEPLIWTDLFILPGSFMSAEDEDDSLIFTNVLVEIEDADEADI